MTESNKDFIKRGRAVCEGIPPGKRAEAYAPCNSPRWGVWTVPDDHCCGDFGEGPRSPGNAKFFAYAYTAFPEALERLEKAEAECERLRHEVAEWEKAYAER